jgi:hypothetical protein
VSGVEHEDEPMQVDEEADEKSQHGIPRRSRLIRRSEDGAMDVRLGRVTPGRSTHRLRRPLHV